MAQVEWKRDDMAVVRCASEDEAVQVAKRVLLDFGFEDVESLVRMWPLIYRDELTIHYAENALFVWCRGDKGLSNRLDMLLEEMATEGALL